MEKHDLNTSYRMTCERGEDYFFHALWFRRLHVHLQHYLFLNKSNAPFQMIFEINVLYEHHRCCTSVLFSVAVAYSLSLICALARLFNLSVSVAFAIAYHMFRSPTSMYLLFCTFRSTNHVGMGEQIVFLKSSEVSF